MLLGVETRDETRYNTVMHAIEAVSMRIGDLGFADFALGWVLWIAIEFEFSYFFFSVC